MPWVRRKQGSPQERSRFSPGSRAVSNCRRRARHRRNQARHNRAGQCSPAWCQINRQQPRASRVWFRSRELSNLRHPDFHPVRRPVALRDPAERQRVVRVEQLVVPRVERTEEEQQEAEPGEREVQGRGPVVANTM